MNLIIFRFNSAKFENVINQLYKKIAKVLPNSEEKFFDYLKNIKEKFDLKNISQTIKNETQILKSIKDEINLTIMEYPYSNEIINVILDLLYLKENSLCFIFEKIMMNKGLDVFSSFIFFAFFLNFFIFSI